MGSRESGRPQYEKQHLQESRYCCPFCKGRTWVDFEIFESNISGEAEALTPIPYFHGFFDDLIMGSKTGLTGQHKALAECARCGAVVHG